MKNLVEVKNLIKHFPVRGGFLNSVIAKVHAVNEVSFDIEKGETLGVVGESGCGKSTLGKMLVRLLEPTSGEILYDGKDISKLSHGEMMPYRQQIQIIFQDPNSSLNPRYTSGGMLKEVLRHHSICPRSEEDGFIANLISKVGLHPDAAAKYPHEFSGGQRQRLAIARALAVSPDFVVADEPVSALDVSVQAQVLNLMKDLKDEMSLTMLFVSHDLKVVNYFCDRLIVMYLGKIMEELPCGEIQAVAKHPYTQVLLEANPISDPDMRHEVSIPEGEVPSPFNPPAGCPFVTRCSYKEDRCETEMPPLIQINEGHRVACWAVNEKTGYAEEAAQA